MIAKAITKTAITSAIQILSVSFSLVLPFVSVSLLSGDANFVIYREYPISFGSFLCLQIEMGFWSAARLKKKEKERLLLPPPKERGLRRTGYTVAGYPFAFFGVPTLIHAKKVELAGEKLREMDVDCGGLLKLAKVWVNDLPGGYEVVLGLQCQDCKYSDSIRIPYTGHKQLFNSTSNRTWSLKDKPQ